MMITGDNHVTNSLKIDYHNHSILYTIRTYRFKYKLLVCCGVELILAEVKQETLDQSKRMRVNKYQTCVFDQNSDSKSQ